MYTGRAVDNKILKYDGRPFTSGEIVDAVVEMTKDEGRTTNAFVFSHSSFVTQQETLK